MCGSNALVITDILQQPGHTLFPITKIPTSQELERERARAREGGAEILAKNWVIIEFYCLPSFSIFSSFVDFNQPLLTVVSSYLKWSKKEALVTLLSGSGSFITH